MALPLRYRALEQIADELRKIAPSAGYHTQPVSVERLYRSWEQFNEFPVLLVVECTSGTTMRPMTQMAYEHHLIVTVYGYAKAEKGISRSQALESLNEDVARALLLPNRGAWSSPILAIMPINDRETDGGLWDPFGGFAEDYDVWMQEDYGAGEQ